MSVPEMMTGKTIGLVVVRSDGSEERHGRWVVPHDSDGIKLMELGESIGWTILQAIAKQGPLPVVSVTVIPWPRGGDMSYLDDIEALQAEGNLDEARRRADALDLQAHWPAALTTVTTGSLGAMEVVEASAARSVSDPTVAAGLLLAGLCREDIAADSAFRVTALALAQRAFGAPLLRLAAPLLNNLLREGFASTPLLAEQSLDFLATFGERYASLGHAGGQVRQLVVEAIARAAGVDDVELAEKWTSGVELFRRRAHPVGSLQVEYLAARKSLIVPLEAAGGPRSNRAVEMVEQGLLRALALASGAVDMARRLVALPNWEWQPGMRIRHDGGIIDGVPTMGGACYIVSVGQKVGKGWYPDLHDPGTAGVLLDMLMRHAWVATWDDRDDTKGLSVSWRDADNHRQPHYHGSTIGIAVGKALLEVHSE